MVNHINMSDDKSSVNTIEGEKRPAQKVTYVTNRREIWAWWMYMAALEPISIVAIQLFFPLYIQDMAMGVGWRRGSTPHSIPCTDDDRSQGNCIVLNIGSWLMSVTTFSHAVNSMAVLTQAILFIGFGALSDHGSVRKHFLVAITVFGTLICLLLAIPLKVNYYSLCWLSIFNVLTILSFGVALMLYNSYLPQLAASHSDTISFQSDDPVEKLKRQDFIANDISAKSYMFGFGAGALVLAIILGATKILGVGDNGFSLFRWAIFFTGLWWIVGSIFPFFYLGNRPGPSLPRGSNWVTFSIRRTARTISTFRRLPDAFLFLISFFLFSDGCNTIATTAVIFADGVLKAKKETLIICSLIAPICGLLGAFFFFKFQQWTRLSSKKMLLLILSIIGGLAIYCFIGIFEQLPFGFKSEIEMYPICIIYGFMMGAMQSYSRVLFAEMIPPGCEAEFFALYSITDKGAAWVGPLIQAFCGSGPIYQRFGILALALMIFIPFPIIIFYLDVSRGKRDALNYSEDVFRLENAGNSSVDVRT